MYSDELKDSFQMNHRTYAYDMPKLSRTSNNDIEIWNFRLFAVER